MVKAYTDNFSLPTAYEGVDFDPPHGEWAQINFLPIQDDVESLGVGGYDLHRGIMQVSFNQPINKGVATLLQRADELRTVFITGQSFTYSGQTVRIEKTERGPIITNDNINLLPMSVYYFSSTVRPGV